MKTADLIPFILLELNSCDQYGFELTKNIETKSNGKIIIKQPTLYTLLKKLEKSKFICSYWQDSDIGGKRHYYKLTENGKLQVSTLPPYSFLLENALKDENEEESFEKVDEQPKQKFSIMDELLNQPTPQETILPSNEVFDENSLDTATELEVNINNSEILKNENNVQDEEFATSKEVSKFTEKLPATQPVKINEVSNKQNNSSSFLDTEFKAPKNEMEVKFVNYENFKNTENYKYAKKLTKNMLFKTLATSASLLIIIALCSIVTYFTGRSSLYHIFFISSGIIAIFYPIIHAINARNFRLKYQQEKFKYQTKKMLFLAMIISLSVVIICVISNIIMKNNSIMAIFSLKNFENLYAPILFSSVIFLDILYCHIFISKINK